LHSTASTPVLPPSVSNTLTRAVATMVVPTSAPQESPAAPPATQKTFPKKPGTIVTFDSSQDDQPQDIKPVAQPKKTGKSPSHRGTLKIDRFAPRTEAQSAVIRKASANTSSVTSARIQSKGEANSPGPPVNTGSETLQAEVTPTNVAEETTDISAFMTNTTDDNNQDSSSTR
jgi:hypothetical protein